MSTWRLIVKVWEDVFPVPGIREDVGGDSNIGIRDPRRWLGGRTSMCGTLRCTIEVPTWSKFVMNLQYRDLALG